MQPLGCFNKPRGLHTSIRTSWWMGRWFRKLSGRLWITWEEVSIPAPHPTSSRVLKPNTP